MNEIDRIAERVTVVKCQMGDQQALKELYLRHGRQVRYYIRRLLEDQDAAADVQQEVWLTVIRNIARLKHPEAFLVWLYRIARSRALDRMHNTRQVDTLSDEAVEDLADKRSDDIADFTPAEAEAIHEGLAKVSPLHREVLLLRFMEDLTYEQIAEIVGCGVGTIRSRLFYAKRALRSELEKHYDTARGDIAPR
jgi:RNA polymerase sigma-70 factor, ECF subfamily